MPSRVILSDSEGSHGQYKTITEEINMKKPERFERVYSQGALCVTQIWIDKETGVNYLYHENGYAGGLTVLLDREGKPVISRVSDSAYSD